MINLWYMSPSDAENTMRQSSATRQPARRTIHFESVCRRALVILSGIAILGLAACGKPSDKTELPGASPLPVAESLLIKATAEGDPKEIKALLDSGENTAAKDILGRTPLHIAAFYGHLKATQLLIAAGADINAKDLVGMAPLHAAVLSGGRREVELLLENKADIKATTDAGQTALHLSAATGQPKLTKYLIEQGADPQSKDVDGKTPLFYASRNQHPQTTALLKQYSGKN